jgi:homoserine kinase type II
MAVYTKLSRQDVERFLANYFLESLVSVEGIAEGVENTNYLIHTGYLRKPYILTLFEQRTNPRDIPFFLELMVWLSERNIPCPKPLHGKDNQFAYAIGHKMATLVEFLPGENNPRITSTHTHLVGEMLAQLHLAAEGFPRTRHNAMSFSAWGDLFSRFRQRSDEISTGLEKEIAAELEYLDRHWPSGLPRGIIHGDVFPDNVMFTTEGPLEISGVIDFYFACNDFWLYDLMITLNAWCFDGYQFVPERAKNLMAAYEHLRPLTAAERKAMPALARAAALRILVTRAYDWLNHVPNAIVVPKDPKEYLAKLRFHQKNGMTGLLDD